MKDYFSEASGDYASYRPSFPEKVFQFIFRHVEEFGSAWDCGTGNGQVAQKLSNYFREIHATDISQSQLKHAFIAKNIAYSVQPAEKTHFQSSYFDLITVGQAVHWFDFSRFYEVVNRVLKPNGVIAVLGYGLIRANTQINQVVDHFYRQIIGPYWDNSRRYLDEAYLTIPFPFTEIRTPEFTMEYKWTLSQFLHYLHTWSSVKTYEQNHGINPVTKVEEMLKNVWIGEETVNFPIFTRMGKLRNNAI